MINAIKTLLMMFYAPARAMADVRDRAPLMQAALIALVTQTLYTVYTQWPHLSGNLNARSLFTLLAVVLVSARTLFVLAVIFTPLVIFFANLFGERRQVSLVVRHEYAASSATLLYAWAAANLAALPLAALSRINGFERAVIDQSLQRAAEWQRALPPNTPPLVYEQQMLESFALMIMLPFFGVWAALAVRKVFNFTWGRAFVVIVTVAVVMFITSPLLSILSVVLTSPFLLVMLFLVLRGYFGEFMRSQQARASFKQNLEAATLNPADASAHYNLGLIHLNRNELDEARARFNRAVEIDPEEIDSHYQLGRLDRKGNHFAEAIKHFEQVVSNDQTHAQHEIWREIGATYLDANQFADAHDALERFLDNRQSDPEGLYLMGRALAGMKREREAAEFMRRCIEAVQTAPAYKRRTEARWMSEAQQFLRTLDAQSA